jgi:hypothetical protein
MRYYFELPAGDGMQYVWCQGFGLGYDVQKGLSYRAHRIWEEDDRGQIIYLKNRSGSTEIQVDTKEFFWVKLQSQPYNRSHA